MWSKNTTNNRGPYRLLALGTITAYILALFTLDPTFRGWESAFARQLPVTARQRVDVSVQNESTT
jgi:hypothetical protein